MAVLRDHRGPLSADLRGEYNCNLTDVLAGRVAPLSDVCEWVAHLGPGTAVYRAMNPDGSWAHTEELELQRALVYELRKANFFLAHLAKYRATEPEHYLFSWEQGVEDEGVIKGDAMSTEEADDFLGWSLEMKDQLSS